MNACPWHAVPALCRVALKHACMHAYVQQLLCTSRVAMARPLTRAVQHEVVLITVAGQLLPEPVREVVLHVLHGSQQRAVLIYTVHVELS